MAINMSSFKRKTSAGGASTTKGPKGTKKTGGGVNPMEILSIGVEVTQAIGNLYTTIKTERERTEQARQVTKQVKLECDTRIKELELTLKKDIAMLEESLERYREDTKVKIKEIDTNKEMCFKQIDKEMQIASQEHEARMYALRMQEKTLDTMLELYREYFMKKINGELDIEFDFDEIKLCIKGLETSIVKLKDPSRTEAIEARYVEVEEV